MFRSIELKNIKARGWAAEFLRTQASGMTGHLDEVIAPFCTKYWDSEDKDAVSGEDAFLGGMTDVEGIDKWVFFEQTGYWIDGMVRCAHLIGDERLYEKVRPKLYLPIAHADPDGYIGPHFLKDGMVWAHAVYFRALEAEYEATGDGRILEALRKHFLRAPLKDVYVKNKDSRIMTVRDVSDIETALWIYGQTGEKAFLTMAEESYRRFNKLYANDRGVAPHAKTRALTVCGMLEDGNARNNHGVTYCEICKLAAILHLYTGKEVYRRAAVKAFDKAYAENILIDGVISSSEYLNGNDDSRASHETCDVSDFTWALGYLYMITGESKYGDWVEDAVFNGGFGSVSDDFRSNQYFSCPNQVLCDDRSNHNRFYSGTNWMSYAPADAMACCTGNVNRFFPNFILRSWMQSGDILAPFVYAPTEASFQVGGTRVTIREDTLYPFENTVRFAVSAPEDTAFCLRLRVPGWAVGSRLRINGADADIHPENGVYDLRRTFRNGDVIELTLEDEIRMIENAGGISVKKGALLYCLPVAEKKVIEIKPRGLGNPDYPHFSLYADSKWNYALCAQAKDEAVFRAGPVLQKPWTADGNGMRITLPAREAEGWTEVRCTKVRMNLNPRKKGKIVDRDCTFTPLVPKKGRFACGRSETVSLAPYCTTRLRIAIFPEYDKD